jgi:hypothetical protein
MGACLLGVAGCALVGTFVVSQVVHLWTLRNMIIIVPALTWGVAWLVVGLPRAELARKLLAVAVLAASLASFVPLARDLARPYKTDWRGLVLYLAGERAAQPSATFSFFGGGPQRQFVAADREGGSDPYLERIYDRVDSHPRTASAVSALRRIPGPQVVVYYAGVARPDPVTTERAILRRLNDASCAAVPVYGFAVVKCG